MFDLNPLENPDAIWQHALMLLVSLGLGYMIGFIYGNDKVRGLKIRLTKLDKDLEICQNLKFGGKKHEGSLPDLASEDTSSNFRTTITKPENNDLKIIEGIGPKIEILLHEAGIYTFTQLKDTDPDQISDILERAGSSFQTHDTTTWPRQAELAAGEKWEELRLWQEELKKGTED